VRSAKSIKKDRV